MAGRRSRASHSLCALANYRELTAHTLAGCWWGAPVVIAPFVLWLSRRNVREALALGPPEPTPGVDAPSAGPLDPGPPVRERAVGRFALAMLGITLVALFEASVLVIAW